MATTQIRSSTQIAAASITADRFVSSLNLSTSQLAEGSLFFKKDGTVAMTAALNAGGFAVTNVGAPTAASDVTTKSYVDGLVNGLTIHPFVRAVAVANVTLSGTQTIDGVALSAGDRVLLTAQTTASQNGPWVVQSGAWTRPVDWAAGSTQTQGGYFISEPDGTTYKNTKWFSTSASTITVDTTSAPFTQDLSGTTYSAGAGLALGGTTFSVSLAATSGLSTASGLSVVGNATNLISVTASGVGISASSSAGQLIVGNGSNVPTWTTMSGDATLSGTGVLSITRTAGVGFLKYTDFVFFETPSGTINGVNTSFTLASAPQVSSLQLFLNGIALEPGAGNDFTVSGTTITMLVVPQTGDKLRAHYIK